MIPPPAPSSVRELVELIRSHPRLIPVGSRSKPRLSATAGNFTPVSILGVRGIVEYEPDEYTITALAGTRLAELAAALRERGQYLPFDPLFVQSGASLGGTVAAGTSGPGRFRFGGVRDFILGVRFVDGLARLLRVGGKVVKNAAGFDLPKFFVGSCGRLGVLAEVTLKVFPRPESTLTLRLPTDSTAEAVAFLIEAGKSRWQPDALDMPPDGDTVLLRLAGPLRALKSISQAILARWPGSVLSDTEAEAFWSDLREVRWAPMDGILIKVALNLASVAAVIAAVRSYPSARVQVSAGGSVAYVWLPSGETVPQFNAQLRTLGLPAVTLRGEAPLWLGLRRATEIARAVKGALDPEGRFPSLEE